MNIQHMLTCALLLASPTALAEIPGHLPDLAKALSGGKLTHQADVKMMTGYRYEYGADLDFEALKKKLKKFLGEGWKEQEVDPQKAKAFKQIMKVEGVDIAGYATFTNPAFPGHEISLRMRKEKFDEKEWSIVDITGTWNKKE